MPALRHLGNKKPLGPRPDLQGLGRDKLDFERFRAVLDETDKSLPFVDQRGANLWRQWLKRLNHESCHVARAFNLPGAAHKAIDQKRRPHPTNSEENGLAVLSRYEAAAVGVREDQVVKLRQEAHRRGNV